MMEEEQLSKTLPEVLVERIVSMMPFPAILKARGLSKSWRAKFSPVSRQKVEEKKQAAVAFQKLVREQSTKWIIFFPVCRDKYFFSACDWQRQQWIRFPIPSILRPLYPTSKSCPIVLGLEGTLLYCARRNFYTFYVANVFTRIWKKLPVRPMLSKASSTDSIICAGLSPILVRDTSLETYKLFVLLGYQGGHMFDRWHVQIYDSALGSWSTKHLVEGVAGLHTGGEPFGSPVYFNGVLYARTWNFVGEDLNNVVYLMTFNIDKGYFEELALSMNRAICCIGEPVVDLVVCCAKLMMIITWHDSDDPCLTSPDAPCALLHVLTVDVESRQLLEVTRAPTYTLDIHNDYRVCSDGKFIFFKSMDNRMVTSMIAYDVQEDAWACLDIPLPTAAADAIWCQSAVFHPGLNPFAEV